VGTITLTLPQAHTSANAGPVATNFTDLQTLLNGNLDNANISASAVLDAVARIGVRKNSTGSVFQRRRLNLIEGTGITLTVADDSGNEEVDVTIASTTAFAGVRVSRTSDVTITQNTATTVSWDAETFDTDAFHDNSTNPSRLTIPTGKAGKYLVHACIRITGAGNTVPNVIELRLNGTSTLSQTQDPDNQTVYIAEMSDVVTLADADYVEIRITRGAAANNSTLKSGSTLCHVELIRLGS